MRFIIPFICTICIFLACTKPIDTSNAHDFVEGIVAYAITNKENNIIELPNLYDSLSVGIPEKSTLVLAERLRKKGFVEIGSGSGNYPPRGPQIVTKIFLKDSCVCQVSKIYYSTVEENVFEMAERISCMKQSEYLKQK
jgi:hypothetical protein